MFNILKLMLFFTNGLLLLLLININIFLIIMILIDFKRLLLQLIQIQNQLVQQIKLPNIFNLKDQKFLPIIMLIMNLVKIFQNLFMVKEINIIKVLPDMLQICGHCSVRISVKTQGSPLVNSLKENYTKEINFNFIGLILF